MSLENEQQNEQQVELPWLVFQLDENLFAVNSRYVGTILILPDTVARVPDSSPYLRGVFNLRGTMTSLLDLRLVLGYQSQEQKYQSFADMLEARKQDHLHWVAELERSTKTGEPFTLATDPHNCAFGKWYYNYHTDNMAISHELAQIDAPHRLLHQTAIEMGECNQRHEECQRAECRKETLERAKQEYIPLIVSSLDKMKETFRANFREMVVVLESDKGRIGIVVDSVLSVDAITRSNDANMGRFCNTQYVIGTGTSASVQGSILLLDESKLFQFIDNAASA